MARARPSTYALAVSVTLPTWAAYMAGIGPPVGAFLGVVVTNRFTRKGQTELETRSKREEVMRNLRWAAELAVSEDEDQAKLGTTELIALGRSDLLDQKEQLFVDAALEATVRDPAADLDELGEDTEVVEIVDGDADVDEDELSSGQEEGR